MDEESRSLEGLTAFQLGTRQVHSFDIDPNGLIVREEVFHDADSLLVRDGRWTGDAEDDTAVAYEEVANSGRRQLRR